MTLNTINLRVVRFLLSPWKKNTESSLHARRRRRLYHEVKRGDDDDAVKRENSSRKRRREDRAATENGRRRKPTNHHLLMMEPSKTYENPSNYCLAYLMMLLCWWCRAALIFFFVLYDLVFFLAIKDDVDALVVLWLPRAFMPCNATACVERTFIFVCASFLCRTAEKSSLREGTFWRSSSCEVVKKCSFLGFLEPFQREWPQRPRATQMTEIENLTRKGKKNCIKSKAYLLSRHLYSTRLSHIYIEIYNHVSHLRAIHNTHSYSTRRTKTRDIIYKFRARVCGKSRI